MGIKYSMEGFKNDLKINTVGNSKSHITVGQYYRG